MGHETAKLIAQNAALTAGAEIAKELRQCMESGFGTLHNRITEVCIIQSEHATHISNHNKDIDSLKKDCLKSDDLPTPPKEEHKIGPIMLILITAVVTTLGNLLGTAMLRSVAKELPPIQQQQSDK